MNELFKEISMFDGCGVKQRNKNKIIILANAKLIGLLLPINIFFLHNI